jgi:hypothetical protein
LNPIFVAIDRTLFEPMKLPLPGAEPFAVMLAGERVGASRLRVLHLQRGASGLEADT